MKITRDHTEFLFRALFCLIFVGLGGEHIVSDNLIQKLMPAWVPLPRIASIVCGVWLSFWGLMILLGWRVRLAGVALGVFLVIVTVAVHVPGLIFFPPELPAEHHWMWDILQRTNLVKNLCLLGVCFHLLTHQVGKYSLEGWLAQTSQGASDE